MSKSLYFRRFSGVFYGTAVIPSQTRYCFLLTLGRISLSCNVSLTPGFSPVMSERLRSEPFQRFGRGASPQWCRKRLKPFRFLPAAHTRLKPGVNGTRIQLQEI